MHSLPVSFELFILIMNFKPWSSHSTAALKSKQLIQLQCKSREQIAHHIFNIKYVLSSSYKRYKNGPNKYFASQTQSLL